MAVAYYTVGSHYEEKSYRLMNSCLRLNIPVYIKQYHDRGNWARNCAICPEFIQECLDRFVGDELLYVDADAIICRDPTLEQTDYDIAAHVHHNQVQSCAIIVRPTTRSRNLINKWVTIQQQDPEVYDQITLQQAIQQVPIKFLTLSKEYWFRAAPDNDDDLHLTNAVICYQMTRQR